MPCCVFQQPTLSDMTMYEMNFSLLVEDMLGNIDQPKYRQIVVEVRAQSPLPACSPEHAQRDARAARSGTPLTGPSAGPEGDGHPGPGQGTGVHGERTGREARPPVWEGDGNVSARVAAAVHAIGFDVRPFQLLMVVSVVLERNPELEFQDKVDLDKLVKEAFHEFQKDESRLKEVEKQDDMTSFYNTPPLGRRGTCSYLTKVVMNLLLEGEVKPNSDDPCLVS